MLTSIGAKQLDFGLAKPAVAVATAATLTVTASTSPVTEQGTIVGTFQYMSPEQVEGKELDGRSDIFSLGAVLYEMVTGRRAFEGKSQLSVASAILEKEPEPISSIKPMTPLGLDRVVKKCLAKEPDERWQSASDLKTELTFDAESLGYGLVRWDNPPAGQQERGAAQGFLDARDAESIDGVWVTGKGPEDAVFTRGSKPVADFRGTWDKITLAAGCPGLLFRDLRRSAVRNMVRAGHPRSGLHEGFRPQDA